MSTQLDETAIGLVVGRSGQAAPLLKSHTNVFIYEEDDEGQIPLSFLKDIIEIYSAPGDWILAGPTEIGKCTSM